MLMDPGMGAAEIIKGPKYGVSAGQKQISTIQRHLELKKWTNVLESGPDYEHLINKVRLKIEKSESIKPTSMIAKGMSQSSQALAAAIAAAAAAAAAYGASVQGEVI